MPMSIQGLNEKTKKEYESILQIQHHSKHPATKFIQKFPILLHSCASSTCKKTGKKNNG